MTATTALDLAELWRARGVPVFPVRLWHDGTKTNKGTFKDSHGFLDATTDAARMVELFGGVRLWGGSVLGVGLHLGPAGLLAVDVDGAEGLERWRELDLPATFEVATPSGGRHLWYRKREPVNVSHSNGCLPGVDVVRADEGFVVAPGTVTPWGEWISHDAWPDDVEPAPLDLWDVLDRAGGGRSSGGVRVRGETDVLEYLERDGREQDAEALRVLIDHYGAHHPFLTGGPAVCVTRPGREAGTSATIGYSAPGQVQVFSTDWPNLPAGRYVVAGDALVSTDDMERQTLDELMPAPTSKQTPADEPESDDQRPLGLITTRLSTIEPEPVSWVWQGYLPLGKITMLDGMPDLGKSTIAVDLASRVTTGGAMPDGSSSGLDAPADVVMFTAEDGLADTVRPRVDAAGGDAARVHVVRAAVGRNKAGKPIERWPTLASDLAALERTMLDLGARLVVVDVLMAYLGTETNSYRDQDMRAVLSPLAAMAERVACAVLLLRHPTKGTNPDPVLAGGGSIGIVGAARVGLLVGFDPDDTAPPNDRRRLLAVSKCNIAPKAPTLSYRIVQDAGRFAARIDWGESTAHRADQLIVGATTGPREDSTAMTVARELIEDLPMLAPDAHAQCRLAGLSHEAVLRALKKLGGCSKKLSGDIAGGPNLGWAWFAHAPFADEVESMRAEALRRKMTHSPEGDRLREQSSSGESVIFRESDGPSEVDL